MRVEKHTSPTGQWGLQAFAEDYDGTPPLPIVQFDRQPRTLSPDRVALASYLFFGPWMSGRYTSPQWHSPALSQAISRDAHPAWLQTEPVELYAKALPKGRRSFSVSLQGADLTHDPLERDSQAPSLRFMRSDLSSGARVWGPSLELSTNAWLLASGQSVVRQLRVVLGCAVLFAEDVDADEVVIGHSGPSPEVAGLFDLVGASRLGLRLVSDHGGDATHE